MYKIIKLFLLIQIFIVLIIITSCSNLESNNEYKLKEAINTNIIFGFIESLNPLIISGFEFGINRDRFSKIKNDGLNFYDKLREGQNVIANYTNLEDSLEITSIKSDYIIIAPVSFVSSNELIVLNQKVVIPDNISKEIPEIIPGHWVRISGLYQKEGKIIANYIEVIPSQSFGFIKGKVSQIEKSFISIGKQKFEIRAPFTSTISGDIVKIVFTKDGDLFKTFKVENLSNQYLNLVNRNIIVEGFVFEGDDKKMRLSGYPFVIYNSNHLIAGKKVLIKGRILPGSIIDN